MSSYLSIYVKPKDIDKKISIYTFSRSSEIYQFFYENNLSIYAYESMNSEERYKELNSEEYAYALCSLRDEIASDEKRYAFREKHLKKDDDLDDLYSTREYIDEKIELLHNLDMISLLLDDVKYKCGDIEKVYTNYD